MREIKFRAWVKPGTQPELDGRIIPVEEMEWNYRSNDELLYVILPDPSGGDGAWEVETKNMELMQFTGVTDQDGRDIYEGDIVTGDRPHYINEVKGVVKYGALAFCFIGESEDGKEWVDTVTNPTMTQLDHIEVIGNIYENPELLE
jgi:uncharacterized phage protein (TIGR01671 family)